MCLNFLCDDKFFCICCLIAFSDNKIVFNVVLLMIGRQMQKLGGEVPQVLLVVIVARAKQWIV